MAEPVLGSRSAPSAFGPRCAVDPTRGSDQVRTESANDSPTKNGFAGMLTAARAAWRRTSGRNRSAPTQSFLSASTALIPAIAALQAQIGGFPKANRSDLPKGSASRAASTDGRHDASTHMTRIG
jgi:hypothetical protein